MVRIVADTSTMYSSKQAGEAGFAVSPLAVTIGGETYRELDEIEHDGFLELIAQGNMPRSSQPAMGDVLDVYKQYEGEEILNIAMADGLSGTYSMAVMAAENCGRKDEITVINSGTLCGPHRCLVETAVKLAGKGLNLQGIKARLEDMMSTEKSFLVPSDFDYLRRGGRLSPLVSFVGKSIKLAPVMTLSPDRRQLVISGVKRSFKQALAHIGRELTSHGVGEGWKIYVAHAGAETLAAQAKAAMEELFPMLRAEVFKLTPAFITQGGPGCVAVQVIREGQEA